MDGDQPGGGPGGRPPQSPSDAAEASTSGAAAAAPAAGDRETLLGNCVRCGSSDKLKFCSRCQAVRYCGPVCQKADVSTARAGEEGKKAAALRH